MDTRSIRAVRRLALALFLAGGLGGCAVYAPPYAAYDPYYSYPAYSYPAYGYPAYVGPPIALDFGFGYYEHRHSHGHGYHGKHQGWRSHGWAGRGGGGWGHRGWYGRGRR